MEKLVFFLNFLALVLRYGHIKNIRFIGIFGLKRATVFMAKIGTSSQSGQSKYKELSLHRVWMARLGLIG